MTKPDYITTRAEWQAAKQPARGLNKYSRRTNIAEKRSIFQRPVSEIVAEKTATAARDPEKISNELEKIRQTLLSHGVRVRKN